LADAEKELEEKQADLVDSLKKKDEAYKQKNSAEQVLDTINDKEEMKKANEEDPDEVLDKLKAESKIVMVSTINSIKAGEKLAAKHKKAKEMKSHKDVEDIQDKSENKTEAEQKEADKTQEVLETKASD
jgi:predicted MPP superfamily phosphohydrolase